jgi:hypothetical protein
LPVAGAVTAKRAKTSARKGVSKKTAAGKSGPKPMKKSLRKRSGAEQVAGDIVCEGPKGIVFFERRELDRQDVVGCSITHW